MIILDTRSHLSVSEPDAEFDFVQANVIGEVITGATATIYLEAKVGSELRVQKEHDTLAVLPIRVGQPLYVSRRSNQTHVVSDAE